MGQLIVRNLDDDLVHRLKERAAAHGISAEEEHRRILRDALRPDDRSFLDHLLSMPDVGEDWMFERRKDPPRDIEL